MKKLKKFVMIIMAACMLAGCSGTKQETAENPPENQEIEEEDTGTQESEAQEPEDAAEQEIPPVSENVITDEGFDQFAPPSTGDTVAVIKTNKGDIKIKFFKDDAPKAVENFTTHAKNGYYNDLNFCRVIDGFMIQGGSPTNDSMGGESIYGTPFEDEFSPRLHNYRGAVSMANSGPNTNGSQFFIVQAGPVDDMTADYLQQVSEYTEAMYQDNRTLEIISGAQRFTKKAVETYGTVGGTPHLDGGFPVDPSQRSWHTVFAQVYEGMEVVDAIAAVETGEGDMPLEPVVIESIEVSVY